MRVGSVLSLLVGGPWEPLVTWLQTSERGSASPIRWHVRLRQPQENELAQEDELALVAMDRRWQVRERRVRRLQQQYLPG